MAKKTPEQQSPTCDFKDTTTGHPCENPVEPGNDHCAAGHKVAVGPQAKVSTKNAELKAETGVAGIDELVKSAPTASLEKELDEAHGEATLQFLTESVNLDKPFSFAGIKEISTGSGKTRKFLQFDHPELGTLLRGGFTSSDKHRHWYRVTTCKRIDTEKAGKGVEELCGAEAYDWVPSQSWYGSKRADSLEERTSIFTSTIEVLKSENNSVSMCPTHRTEYLKSLPAPEDDETFE